MDIPSDEIVTLPSVVSCSNGRVCETCSSPRLTDAFCRACAFHLVDDALASGAEGLAVLGADLVEGSGTPTESFRFSYEHYEICRSAEGNPWELGRGAMGITYKATDTRLNCPVALKIINTSRLGGVSARTRLVHEAQTAARLRHANIASIFHLGLGEENTFYAMEFIEGETLESRVNREGSLPCGVALSILRQCARALQLAHSRKFIHRDIKPTNIMLVDGRDHDGGISVKLIDFGLVKAVIGDAEDDTCCKAYFAGTPCYASPEQLQAGAVDARSDIYSLGVCLGYMLSGTTPTASLEKAPPSVITLFESMVSPNSDARPQSAGDLLARIAELEKIAVGSGGAGQGDLEDGQQRRRRKIPTTSLAFSSAAVLLALSVLGTGLGRWLWSNGSRPTVGSIPVEAQVLCAQATELYRKYDKADNEQAIVLYSKAIALFPGYAEAEAMLASAYFDRVCRYGAPKDQLNLATAAATRAIASDPKTAKAYQVLGAIRNFKGEPWEALVQVRHALELDPNSALAMCDFSLLWTCVGEPRFALPWAKAATRIEPAKVQCWHAAAEASVELCDDEQSEDFYRRCIVLKPAWMSGYCGLIHLHLLQGNFPLARQDFAKAESVQSGLLLPLTLKAQIELFSGEYTEAEACYRQLLGMYRHGSARYYSGISYLSALGFLRLRAGDLTESDELLNEAAKLHLDSEGSEDIYDLAAIRAIQGRKEDSLSLLNQAIISGWNDFRATRLDPRFSILRSEPRFQGMLDQLSRHVGQMRNEAHALCTKPINLADYSIDQRRRKN